MLDEIKALIAERDMLNRQIINAHTIADKLSTSDQRYASRSNATKLMPSVGKLNKRLRDLQKLFPEEYASYQRESTAKWFALYEQGKILTEETKDALQRSSKKKSVSAQLLSEA